MTSETPSLNLMRVEEETFTTVQEKMGQSSANPNENTNSNPKTPTKP
jgi:hypothetical protein